MSLWMTIRVAWRALWTNKMRTLLTMLGIIIGVAAVITMLSIGNGAKIAVQKQIESMGTNTVHVWPGSSRRGGVRGGRGTSSLRLTVDDYLAVERLPLVARACPMINGSAQLVFGTNNWNCGFYGTTPDFVSIRNWPVDNGRMFTDLEVRAAANVCVLGSVSAEKLFGSADPVGQTIRVSHLPFKVLGVLSVKGDMGWGRSQDDTLIMPYTTAQRKLVGIDFIHYMSLSAERADQIEAIQKQVIALLEERHRVTKSNDDEETFGAFNQAEISETANASTQVFGMLLGGIASVSLLVGGIGIMNIMLVSVTERIREIGIRMAVGARGVDILMQFLIESVVLCLIGGAIGVAVGIGASNAMASMAQWPAVVSHSSIAIAFGFSAAIGIFFGFYPALRASRLDPIEALRHQ
ncbi:MAG: ABC transporter permease [Armatimonadetes bacterium]|nr:ABC transporter permease [Armatimonadota bacterium]